MTNKVDFTGKHIHILIPAYGGLMNVNTCAPLIGFFQLCNKLNLQWSIDFMTNESLIPRGRNSLCAKALYNPKVTHLMFIDADIGFHPDHIIGMMLADKDVIGGLYPKKALPIDYNFNIKRGGKIEGPLVECDTIATGFLLFKREVYEKLIEAHKDKKVVDDIGLGKEYEPYLYAIFDTEIDEQGHYLSEDWLFCRRWAKLGGEVWADTRVLLDHVGNYVFTGTIQDLSRKGLKIEYSGDNNVQ